MPVLTILCHGTDNSRDTATSGGNTLVISKIAELLAGVEGTDWMLLEGAGTEKLREQGVDSEPHAGILWGGGVQANVDKAVKFATHGFRANPLEAQRVGTKIRITGTTVNLAGHSRGSITCYKIAHALRKVPGIRINIFAIDTVPGNNGSINKEMHEHIELGDNVNNSFLMLAKSEHRLNFRPYVDALYSIGQPNHKFDTIPGTHGGINELQGGQAEAACLVLSRAVKFLKKNGSRFRPLAEGSILSDKDALVLYARTMLRIKEYKRFASVNPFKARSAEEAKALIMNLATTSLNVDKHRIANVADDKTTWGGAKPKGLFNVVKGQVTEGIAKHSTTPEGRDAHHGLNLGTAIERMTGEKAHSLRANRFFANQQHEKLFEAVYPAIFGAVRKAERGGERKDLVAFGSLVGAFKESCSPTEKEYMERFFCGNDGRVRRTTLTRVL